MANQEIGFPASPVKERRRTPIKRTVTMPNNYGPWDQKPSPLPNHIPGENRMTLLPNYIKQRTPVDTATQRDQMIAMLLNAYKNRMFR